MVGVPDGSPAGSLSSMSHSVVESTGASADPSGDALQAVTDSTAEAARTGASADPSGDAGTKPITTALKKSVYPHSAQMTMTWG